MVVDRSCGDPFPPSVFSIPAPNGLATLERELIGALEVAIGISPIRELSLPTQLDATPQPPTIRRDYISLWTALAPLLTPRPVALTS